MGFLETVEYKPSTVVDQGDLLFTIEDEEFRAEYDRADAELQSAQAQLANAKIQLEQANAARAQFRDAVSDSEVAKLTADQGMAEAAVKRAQAQVALKKRDLDKTKIHAPIRGFVKRQSREPGNLVGAGEFTVLTTVIQLDPMDASFFVGQEVINSFLDKYGDRFVREKDEGGKPIDNKESGEGDESQKPVRDAAQASPSGGAGNSAATAEEEDEEGLKVFLARDKDEPYSFQGTIYYLDIEVDPQTGKGEIRASFPNPDHRLAPGVSVYLRKPLDPQPDAILVREAAIQTDMTGKFVLVVGENDIVEKRRVELGSLLGGMRVIRSGLSAGERYVVEGVLKARPEMPVKPELVDDSGVDLGEYEVPELPEEPAGAEAKSSPKDVPRGEPAKPAPTPASAPPD
jgi:multidrug efflux pump subunit AcrA (membrane-fusion protein)